MAITKGDEKTPNSTNDYFGVYANLAHAQDWRIKGDKTTGAISVKTYSTGGHGDLYFMSDKDPNKVTQMYHTIVGKPVLTPQWALGWSQCKYGYKSTEELREVVGNYSQFGLPLDTQWSDIDYLDRYRDFTYNPEAYAGLPDFVKGIQAKGMHYIPIVDAGIAKRPGQGYKAYDSGVE